MLPEINLILGKVGSFTLFAGMGLVSIVCLSMRQTKKLRLDKRTEQRILQSIPIVTILAVVPAMLSDVVFRWPNCIDNPKSIGVTFYGWLIGCISGWYIFAVVAKLRFLFVLNFFAPMLALAQAFGRVGCFLGGCCYGRPSGCSIGVRFPEQSLPWTYYGELPLFPVQLIDSCWLLLVFIVLWRMCRFENRIAMYLILIGTGRFFVEYLRGDVRGTFFGLGLLSPAQFMSVVFGSCGIVARLSSIRKNGVARFPARQCGSTVSAPIDNGFSGGESKMAVADRIAVSWIVRPHDNRTGIGKWFLGLP